MKKIIVTIILILSLSSLVGCDTLDVDTQQKQQQEQMLQDMQNQVGMPNIKEWTEKKLAKEILELRDTSKLITYTYLKNLEGRFVYIGQSIGYGIPDSVKYTNPMKVEYSTLAIPQADPTGLFMPEGLKGTWIQYINQDTGKRELLYTESEIVVSQSKLPKRLCAEWSLPTDY